MRNILFLALFCLVLASVTALPGCGGSAPQAPAKQAPAAAPAEESAPAAPAPVPAIKEAPVAAPAQAAPPTPATPAAQATPPAPDAQAAPATPDAQAAPATPDAQATPPAPDAQAAPDAPGDGPKIVCEEPVFDFGETDVEKIDHAFVLKNAGNATLIITGVKPACGCTTAKMATQTLEPGQEVKLETSLSLKGRQGMQNKTIGIESNDPLTPVLQLALKGSVIPKIAVAPETINLGRIMDDEPRSASLTVKSNKPDLVFKIQSVEITGFESPSGPLMDFTISETDPGREYKVDIFSKGALPPAMYNGRITIRTDCVDRAVIFLPMTCQVVGAVTITPQTISIRATDDPDATDTQHVTVKAGRVKEFKLLEVIPPVEGIGVEITPRDDWYQVKLSNIPRKMDLNGKAFIIKIDNPETPETTLPIRVYNLPAFGRKPAAPQAQAVPPPAPAPAPVAVPEAARQVVEAPVTAPPAQP